MYEYEDFICNNITRRTESMFAEDMRDNEELLHSKLEGKSVLVIGGAGSIGSAFTESVLHYSPEELCVVDTNENGLTELTRWLRSEGKSLPEKYLSYPMDYSSEAFRRMFKNHGGFDIVANFSAHKHVRSEKDIFSIEAMLRNNLINAFGFLDLLCEFKPDLYFCVSTDKAANPVNIMGASKRLMEDMIFSFSDEFDVKTARFANVAFSNGSLLDGFVHRINNKQPLSAPSDVKRFFVSQRESGQICLLAALAGNNREIFFPKLEGEQMMRFDQIALKFLKQYGYTPVECSSEKEALKLSEGLKAGSRDYPVFFSASDTSGEKQYEEFYTENEHVEFSRFQGLGVVEEKETPDRKAIEVLIGKLSSAFGSPSACKEEIVKIISEYLPNFEHIETGKSLDSKM